jgi:hypothetical protein
MVVTGINCDQKDFESFIGPTKGGFGTGINFGNIPKKSVKGKNFFFNIFIHTALSQYLKPSRIANT